MTEASPVLVAANQDHKAFSRKQPDRHVKLVPSLCSLNVPAVEAQHSIVDLQWWIEGAPVMFDLKTGPDVVASARDGRLYDQLTAMKDAGSVLCGFVIVGPIHHTIGHDNWSFDAFDNQLLRLQCDGAKIVTAESDEETPRRVASLYRWTIESMSKVGGYAAPAPIVPASDFERGLIFYDKGFRSRVGMTMHLPRMGVVTANSLLERHSLMEVLGITSEGLERAKEIWKAMDGVGAKKIKDWEGFLRA